MSETLDEQSRYNDFVYCDKEMVDEFTPKAESFIDAIKALQKQ